MRPYFFIRENMPAEPHKPSQFPATFPSEEKKGAVSKVTAIVRHFKVEAVFNILRSMGVTGLTVTDVREWGHQKGHKEKYRGAEFTVDFLPKAQVVVYVQRNTAQLIASAIAKEAHTGQVGDGIVTVEDIADFMSIRTGEHGEKAL